MSQVSATELYDLYRDTVGRCTSDLRNRSDDEVLYDLFEEFDIGVHSLLHEDSLARLHDAGYIDEEMVEISKRVRERWIALTTESWTVTEIKSEKEWHELFELCDRLNTKSMRG